jgi:hypothetical protein
MVTFLEDTSAYESYDGAAWIGFGGGSGILQVVSTAKTDPYTSSAATFQAVTGLSATITPSSATSKILVLAQISYSFQTSAVYHGAYKVTRGGTDIYRGDAAGSRTRAVFGGYTNSNSDLVLNSNAINFLDSPASTSALTYQVEVFPNSTAIFINRTNGDGTDNVIRTRGSSSITLMEVAG